MKTEYYNLINYIVNIGAKYVILGYDGNSKCYINKNFFASSLLSYGINVIDVDSITKSIFSFTIKRTIADVGVLFTNSAENEEFYVFSKEGKILKGITFSKREIQIKNWNEIGSSQKFDYSDIISTYIKLLLKRVIKTKSNMSIVINLNFSPIYRIFPYLLRDFFYKVTTLNALERFNNAYDAGIENNLTDYFFNSYSADIGIEVDLNCERIKIITKDGKISSEDVFKYSLKGIQALDYEVEKVLILNESNSGFGLSYPIIKSIFEQDIKEKTLVFDPVRSTLLFTNYSYWFDSLFTFFTFYIGRYLY